jgi:EAL domain-containing protein (putative c-di-GMP-specific phosphodiesterase class I)
LRLSVVAEGIEDERTWQRARDYRIDYGQGYYLARPEVADRLGNWLRQLPADQRPAA